jgi:tetratricopeptide (TPR) repeat protein
MKKLNGLILPLIVTIAATSHGQNVKEGTPEFECIKTWSTASEYYKNGEFQNSIPYFWTAMACDMTLRPQKEKRLFTSVYDKLSDSYFQLQQIDSAVAVLKLGYRDLEDNGYMYKIGEMFHRSLKQYDSAAVYYRRYYDLSGSVEELKRIAGMWIEAAKYQEALKVYEEYLKKNPTDQETWVYVLDSFKSFYIKYNGREKWLTACDTFAVFFPTASKEFYIGEKLDDLLKKGEYEKAIRTADEILAVDANSKSAWMKKGKALDALRKGKEAIECYEKAYAIDPQDADLICDLARLYLDQGQLARTWSLCLKAKDIKKFGRPYFLIGEAVRDGIRRCSGNTLTMPAKEAYLVAAKYYDMAAAYPDVDVNARTMAGTSRQNGPTKSDCFMGSLGKLKNDPCYDWMPDRDYASPCK